MIISCCDQILQVLVHLKHERFFFYYLLDILQALPGHTWAVSQRSVTLYIFGLVHLLNNLLQVCSHFVHFLNKIPLPLIQFLPHLVALFFRHLISPLFIRVIDACDSINDIWVCFIHVSFFRFSINKYNFYTWISPITVIGIIYHPPSFSTLLRKLVALLFCYWIYHWSWTHTFCRFGFAAGNRQGSSSQSLLPVLHFQAVSGYSCQPHHKIRCRIFSTGPLSQQLTLSSFPFAPCWLFHLQPHRISISVHQWGHRWQFSFCF